MSFFRKVDSDSESESSEEEELLSSEDEGQDAKPSAPKKGSAFLRSDGSSDEDSDDDSDSDDDDDDDSDMDSDVEGGQKKAPVNKFLRGAVSDGSDSEEEVKKIIKSAKDKRADEVQAVIHSIQNAQRIDDWVAISKEFDSLNRLCERQKNVGEAIPSSYIKALVELEDFLTASIAKEKQAAKKMKAPSAKAMNGMKQKLRKTIKENEESVASYRKDPEAFEAATAQAPAEAPSASRERAAAGDAPAGEAADASEEFQTVGRGGRAIAISSEALFKTMATIMEARGRKSTDRAGQIDTLNKLSEVAVSTYQKIRVILALLAVRFDYNASVQAYLPADQWEAARKDIDALLAIVAEDASYVIQEDTEEYDDQIDRLPNQDGEGEIVKVRGSITTFLDRLDDEFTKSLQNIDPHTPEYVERLSDEKWLYSTIIRAQHYFEQRSLDDALDRAVVRRLEHIYSKQEVITHALEAACSDAYATTKSRFCPEPAQIAQKGGATKLVHALCVRLYRSRGAAAERARTRAMLCQIYHHALHAYYQLARDMFLMSHLQEAIAMADAATQILYNRVVVQLGICAFRVGLIRESQTALQDIFGSGRVKELLAQGLQRSGQYNTITPEQEKIEKQRQLPFHMHINLELLECIYLVGSMLLEIPNMAFAGNDPELRKRVISRPFRRMLDYTDRQIFSGPPENTRDHVMQASKALQNGDWQSSVELINDISIWKLMPNADKVKKMLAKRIQTEGLRTYLFTYASYYDTVSFDHLSATFDLTESEVRAIVSKMIWSEELPASLDPFKKVIVLHRAELSKVQQLAQALADKVSYTLEQNEKTLAAETAKGAGDGKDRAAGDRERNDGGGPRREGRRTGGGGGRGRGRGRSQFTHSFIGQKV
ncbi:eukaryotic translation initiation factor 3 subunit C [Tilletiaria anomala UBC 951]|uniref:Eukaryotic translation initiation factor 3 subunit C n=1 Tax=Tilletiaria anomala (strain ATCC 24038 / CBS 436.72 / UBC 951) TaxID=1037660 RepID=A0A066W455_TILAU|nr:eukaryotic translation initiation factor 3 subunit C [Tilletiaria anomala UBC 951]KDN48516.1 eukaryotic translation initiation factor 3 subunit C [Tilletiaria anomala UBC 951]